MKLGFIILAHDNPDAVRRQVDILAGAGHTVVIHFDKKAPATQREAVCSIEKVYPGKVRVISQVHCVWGEWSLVEAVIVALSEFERMPEKPEYIHLMSGADFPIRPLTELEEFLRRNPDKDFIECCDITERPWVKGGLSMERFWFYFPVNFRTQRKTFDRLVFLQRKLKIRRKIPHNMTPHMGSQWWTLRWESCSKILDFLKQNPSVIRYYRSTWIPDESFFQTVLAHLIPRDEIANLQLILYHLTPTGRPYIFYPDHIPLIRKLPHFFIRKVSAATLSSIESLSQSRRSPIPRPSHLARVRDRISAAIDKNYKHSAFVPGHPYGTLPLSKSKTVLVFLCENDAEIAFVRAHAIAHYGAIWLGRPFAPDGIKLTEPLMTKAGFTCDMTKVREDFTEQFVDTMAAALPDGEVAVLVVHMEDNPYHSFKLTRIPGVRIMSLFPRPFFPTFLNHKIGYVSARKVARLFDHLALVEKSESYASAPTLAVHDFERIENYFHMDVTIETKHNDTLSWALILPGVSEPQLPQAVIRCTPPFSSPSRYRLLFLVDDGCYLDISKTYPAYLLLEFSIAASPVPYTLNALRDSNTDDLLSVLESFKVAPAF